MVRPGLTGTAGTGLVTPIAWQALPVTAVGRGRKRATGLRLPNTSRFWKGTSTWLAPPHRPARTSRPCLHQKCYHDKIGPEAPNCLSHRHTFLRSLPEMVAPERQHALGRPWRASNLSDALHRPTHDSWGDGDRRVADVSEACSKWASPRYLNQAADRATA